MIFQLRQSQPRHLLLRDERLEESQNLPDPNVLAQEIVADLEAALEQFREIALEQATKQSAKHNWNRGR